MLLIRHCRTSIFPRLTLCFPVSRYTMSTASATSAEVAETTSLKHYGQPTHSTHPHLIKHDEVVPGLTVEEFRRRRLRLISSLQMFASSSSTSPMERHKVTSHLLIVPAAKKKYMSGKIPYPFRQDSNFYYLTGCLEPESILAIHADENTNVRTTLFMRPKNADAEMWDGARTGSSEAVRMFGVDEAYDIFEFSKIIPKHIKEIKPTIWYESDKSEHFELNKQIVNMSKDAGALMRSPITYIQNMRMRKSVSEQELLRKSCDIAAQAINDTIMQTSSKFSEHQLAAYVQYKCLQRDANYLAYPPVVASGVNATTIHYISNNQVLKNGDLILMDAGCDYAGYSSDISRTWPISGKFNDIQKLLYDVLLMLQKDLISLVMCDGGQSLTDLNNTMLQRLGVYLREIGLIKKIVTGEEELKNAAREFCPHAVGHYLGLDLHDADNMPRQACLQRGMVFTIEPGVYIQQERADVPKEFRGIGIRIEDDILITNDEKVEVLTAKCIKEPNEIEKLMEQTHKR